MCFILITDRNVPSVEGDMPAARRDAGAGVRAHLAGHGRRPRSGRNSRRGLVLDHRREHANPLGPTTWFFWHDFPLTGTFFVAETLPLLLAAAMGIRDGLRREGNWRGLRAEFVAILLLLAGAVLRHYGQWTVSLPLFPAAHPPARASGGPHLGCALARK